MWMNVKCFLPMDSAVKCVLTLRVLSTVTAWRDTNSFGHSYAQVYIALTKKLSRQYQKPNADIDECSEGIDTCSKSGPTPARCINTEGSYRCTCDEYVGYHLSTNGTTCEGMYTL